MVQPDTRALGAACDIVCLCVRSDDDVFAVVSGALLDEMRPGSVVVNHGTGTPGNATRLTDICASRNVGVLDAPVSGGRPGAEARTLATLVGGPGDVFERCKTLFQTFSRHVVHLGNTGAGQTAKMFNNTLLMMNQAAIADIVELALCVDMDPRSLIEALKLGSASSSALTLLNTMVTPDTVEHLSTVEAEDMHIFEAAMRERGIDAQQAIARGMARAIGPIRAKISPERDI